MHHKTLELRQQWCRSLAARKADSVNTTIPRVRIGGGGGGGGSGGDLGFVNGASSSLRYSSWKRAGRWGLYLSLGLSITVVVLNVTNLVICEVGEWHHWLGLPERTKMRTEPLHHLALQGKKSIN